MTGSRDWTVRVRWRTVLGRGQASAGASLSDDKVPRDRTRLALPSANSLAARNEITTVRTGKEQVVKEELTLGKRNVQATQRVQDAVRPEEAS